MGQIARSGKSQEQYDKEIQDVRKEYGNKVLIPPRLLENLKTREYKDIGKAKWLSNESEIKDVKIGEKFFTPDGRLFTKERD
jgi:hypothetical protein